MHCAGKMQDMSYNKFWEQQMLDVIEKPTKEVNELGLSETSHLEKIFKQIQSFGNTNYLTKYLPVNGLWASKQTENCADNFDDGPHLAEAGPDIGEGVTTEGLCAVS